MFSFPSWICLIDLLLQGHNGSIKVDRTSQTDSDGNVMDTSTLEIRVLIEGSKEKGKVKDLKQLSGRFACPRSCEDYSATAPDK